MFYQTELFKLIVIALIACLATFFIPKAYEAIYDDSTITSSAVDLIKWYKSQPSNKAQERASKRFYGQKVCWMGIADDIEYYYNGKSSIRTTNKFRAWFEENNDPPGIEIGKQIKISGRIDYLNQFYVELNNCELLQANNLPLPRIKPQIARPQPRKSAKK